MSFTSYLLDKAARKKIQTPMTPEEILKELNALLDAYTFWTTPDDGSYDGCEAIETKHILNLCSDIRRRNNAP